MAIGPVQLLIVSFDKPHFTGEIVEELRRLRESDVIRLVDALVVQKGDDGSLAAVQWSDLSIDESEELGATVGALVAVSDATLGLLLAFYAGFFLYMGATDLLPEAHEHASWGRVGLTVLGFAAIYGVSLIAA